MKSRFCCAVAALGVALCLPLGPARAQSYPTRSVTVVVPLAAGTGGAGFRQAVTEHWLPALNAFRPEFVLVSAGFDGHALDDMSDLRLDDSDFAWVTERLYEAARTHAGGRLLSMLEGGYEPGALARSVVSHLKALLGHAASAEGTP